MIQKLWTIAVGGSSLWLKVFHTTRDNNIKKVSLCWINGKFSPFTISRKGMENLQLMNTTLMIVRTKNTPGPVLWEKETGKTIVNAKSELCEKNWISLFSPINLA